MANKTKTKQICLKVERLVECASKLNKLPLKRKTDVNFQKFFDPYEEIFDICSCSCYDNSTARTDFRCDQRIPVSEWDAFVDQKLHKGQLGRVKSYCSTKADFPEKRR